MSSIGPQLPPHLQKRKRTPDNGDVDSKASPPAKVTRRENDDDNSDDGYGPSAPARAGRPIGPSLPPHLSESSARITKPSRVLGPSIGPTLPPAQTQDEDDQDSDIDPATPRGAQSTIGPTLPPPTKPTTKRVLGPAPPPADLSQRAPSNPDSDSDDGYGPALPSATTARHGPTLPKTTHSRDDGPAIPKRDDWMIAPPTDTSYKAPDPTKLKNRKFASGPRAATEKKPGGVSSIWTETPEEKLNRLTNAVLGREDPSSTAGTGTAPSSTSSSKSGPADEARIRSYTEQTRGRSLVEEHQAARAAGKARPAASGESAGFRRPGADSRYGRPGGGKEGAEEEDEDDPSKRAFDREKDMAVGGRISNTKRQEIVNRAANFGGRFQKGNYL
ncbi:hypothetical protein B0H66DRAFT_44593 [Apodospora peruviana]|uniref:DUF3752 domain-containing protein n=1 Tax=Apodospora peruviana TaxID=516989 RepID=A0AAE0IRN5_9PEZI|nr:hypothetical protein B0H66DRAFT_44593 [Apodospora peruviana]